MEGYGPLGVDIVLEVLRQGSSQVPGLLRPAEQRLHEWERHCGFYQTLMQIFSNRSVDVNIRWLAVLYIKNGIDRYWRKTAPNALPEEEKLVIKQQLLLSIDEPVHQIATQVAVVISKIARVELKCWPELFPALFESVRSPLHLVQHNSLLILNHVTKMLASKRLAMDRQMFRELSNSIYGHILDLWKAHSAQFFDKAQRHEEHLEEALQLSVLSAKVLRKLTVQGTREFSSDSLQTVFLNAIFEKIRLCLEYRNQIQHNTKLVKMLEKTVKLLSKTLLETQEHHPASFVPLLKQSLEFAANYVFSEEAGVLTFETLLVQCCNIMRAILRCETYRPPKEIKDDSSQNILAAHQTKMSFFTPSVLTEIINRIIMHYFLLNHNELDNWESDPEDYINEEVGESWRYQLRPSIENLYLTLFAEYRSIVTPVVVNLIKTVQASPDTEDMNVLLQKDAVYTAAGLASYNLFEELDFDNWFTYHLRREMHNKSPRFKLLRRRVPWLVGQWVNVKLTASVRPLLYESLLLLMQKDEDLVVRLTAANTLRTAVDDVEFQLDSFLPYMEGSFTSLYNLLRDVSECDTKMHILHVVSLLIERVGSNVRLQVNSLISYLPHLWQESEQHNMLRCAILATLSHLVQGLEGDCASLEHFLLPVIHLATDVTQPPHVYLLEDGLELWQKTLENVPSVSRDLLHLYNNMPSLLELGTENLRTCFGIIERYVLLSGKEFLETFGAGVARTCESMIGAIKPEGGMVVAKVVETIVKSYPSGGVQLMEPVLVKVFNEVFKDEEYTPLLVVYLCIFGEIILRNSSYFSSFINSMATATGKQSDELLGKFLDIWLEKLDAMTRLERRKLTAMGLASLLPVNTKSVTDRFAVILDAAVDVLHEIHRCEDGVYTDCLVLFASDELTDENAEGDSFSVKRLQLSMCDPVHRIPMWQFVRDKVHESQAVHGEAHFHALMECMDSGVAQQLFSFINH
ncbi:importin-11 isoform X2 [Nematostella vectensis]|uniref:importin-11 isoform X2 n=1 Tax=Nematostella vectensis TaxID=45351 RepID=UPI0020771D7A|nr:importin-11 isoform X2 [Nematostella vectensis]